MLQPFARTACLLFFPLCFFAQNSAPVIQQLSVSVDWPSNTLTVVYDVADAENDPLDIQVFLSGDGGKTYTLTDQVVFTGAVGYPVSAGAGKSIQANVSQLAGMGASFRLRLVADDRQPFDFQSLVDLVDSNRLRANLNFVEGIRHRTTGLSHLHAVRDSMDRLFTAQQLHSEFQVFPYAGYTARNVIGTAPGTATPDTVVIVDAHYDSVSNAPGADDNGSGTVGVWEIARLLSRYPTRKTLRYIGFDLEETGLTGSTRYVSSGIPANEKIEGVFNFEMIGYYSDQPNSQELPQGFSIFFPAATAAVAAQEYRGNFITNVGSDEFQKITALFESSATQYVPDLRVITVSEPLAFPIPDLRRSDHTPFWVAKIPALMITDGANFRNKCYHTPGDTLDEKLNFTFMSNVVKATLAAAAQMAGIQHGDWAVTDFDGLVPSRDLLQACSITAGMAPGANRIPGLYFGACGIGDLRIALYNAGGQLLLQENLSGLLKNGWYALGEQALAPGVYFIHAWAAAGSHTFKVAVF